MMKRPYYILFFFFYPLSDELCETFWHISVNQTYYIPVRYFYGIDVVTTTCL